MSTDKSLQSVFDHLTGQDRARASLGEIARKLTRSHHDIERRKRAQRGAWKAERNPRRGFPPDIR